MVKSVNIASFSRCGLLSCETGHDVQPAAERCEHLAGLQGGQEEQDYSRCSHCSDSYVFRELS